MKATAVAPSNTASLHSLTLMGFSAIAIGETLHSLKQTSVTGFDLIIDSDIPLGSGLGSSAALSVAIVAATMIFLGKKVDKKTVNKIAFIIEQKKHGRPSGGDNAVACFGGMLRFQKLAHAKTAAQKTFTVKKKLTGSFFLIDSGRPVESTGEMVSNVNNLKNEKKDMFENFLQRQEKVTNALLPALQEGYEDAVNQLITEGERNLEQIGVVSDSAKALIAMVEKKGGAAKICGAGGRKKGSGTLSGKNT